MCFKVVDVHLPETEQVDTASGAGGDVAVQTLHCVEPVPSGIHCSALFPVEAHPEQLLSRTHQSLHIAHIDHVVVYENLPRKPEPHFARFVVGIALEGGASLGVLVVNVFYRSFHHFG